MREIVRGGSSVGYLFVHKEFDVCLQQEFFGPNTPSLVAVTTGLVFVLIKCNFRRHFA